jgi:pimeloyl-ACP methyl ester carboxylesterase
VSGATANEAAQTEESSAQKPHGGRQQIAACRWMTEQDLRVYSDEFTRTGFQGGLNYYRILEDARYDAQLNTFSGRTIDVPSCFIGGASDWGVRQSPGALEAMQRACTRLQGVHLIEGAGHSLAEERPEELNHVLLEFLCAARAETA